MKSYAPFFLLATSTALCLFFGNLFQADGLYVAAFVFAASGIIVARD